MKLASKLAVAASGLALAFGLTAPVSAATTTADLGSGSISYTGTTSVATSRIVSQPIKAKAGNSYTVTFNLSRPVEAGNNPRELNYTLVNSLSDIKGKGRVTELGQWVVPAGTPAGASAQATASFTADKDQTIYAVAFVPSTGGEATGLGNLDTVWKAGFTVAETTPEKPVAPVEPTKPEPAKPGKVAPTAPAKKDPVKVLPQTGDVKSHVALGVVGLITTALAGAFVFKKF